MVLFLFFDGCCSSTALRLKRHLVGETKMMPVQTNVLYVFVPEDMVGGSLEAWNYNTGTREMAKGPQAYVQPIENRMAFFRGDALHQVRSYNTSSESVLRGSLVLEQYKVPEEALDVVIDYMWMERHGGEMM